MISRIHCKDPRHWHTYRLLPSAILRRVAYPVKPLRFKFVSNHPLSPLPDGIHESLGKVQNLFNQLADRQANKLKFLHGALLRHRAALCHGVFTPLCDCRLLLNVIEE